MEIRSVSAETLVRWRRYLDDAELAQADRFHFEHDRTCYVAAHWLVRKTLTMADGSSPERWRFIRAPNGKPHIDPALGRSELQFNLSHSRKFVACAVTRTSAVGIDVETISWRRPDLRIADRDFSPLEVAILQASPREEQERLFSRFWTLKEAFVKATGEGLRRPFKSFSFSFDPTAVAFHPEDPDEASQWTFLERRPTGNHMLAIAIRRPPTHPLQLSVSHTTVQDAEATRITPP